MNAVAAPEGKTWFGQPRGLTILFLTQMWELFSYYGMRALLVYYMTKQLLFAQEKASLIYGVYTSMAYFTPSVMSFWICPPHCFQASTAKLLPRPLEPRKFTCSTP